MKFRISAMAIGLACVGTAQANQPNIVFDSNNFDSISGPTYYYAANLGQHDAPEVYSQSIEQNLNVNFVHNLSFSITEPLVAAGYVNNHSLYLLNIQFENIAGLTANIYKADDSFYSAFTGSGNVLILNETTFNVGNYYLQVGGTANGANGGSYTISVATAPVPEPETWATLLVGLGLVGLRALQKARVSAVLS